MNQPIESIAIVGGGTAGWMCAAFLAKFLDNQSISIVVIDSPQVPTVGVGEATIPSIQSLHSLLGIDEGDFLQSTSSTFKLGIQFEGWLNGADSYIHAFANYGRAKQGVDFIHWWRRSQELGNPLGFHEYSHGVNLAKFKKFSRPKLDNQDPLLRYRYAYHFDAGLYANFLRQYAIDRGVEHKTQHINAVRLDDGGAIAELIFSDGNSHSSDFYLDASGNASGLLGQALGVGYEDWSSWLLCDSAVAVQTHTHPDDAVPFTRSIAMEAGWQWRIPLRSRTGNGYVFSSRFCSDSQAAESLLGSLPSSPITSPKTIRFTPGRRQVCWKKIVMGLDWPRDF